MGPIHGPDEVDKKNNSFSTIDQYAIGSGMNSANGQPEKPLIQPAVYG